MTTTLFAHTGSFWSSKPAPRDRRFHVACCAWGILLLLGGGCAGEDASTRKSDGVRGKSPTATNIVLISMDTTRADHLGCYGCEKIRTPNLDRLAEEGTRFANCVSSSPVTLTSHATMMTGSYPFVHGARDNGLFLLGEENVTVAEVLRQEGISTHAEVAAGVIGRRYGLAQGFDTYNDTMTATVTDRRAQVLAEYFERTAEDITRHGIELLKKHQDEPFFLFLHYFDPHKSYAAPERFARQYADGYLAEIAFVDEQVGLFLTALDELGLADNTVVILTGDHGEGRGQHGERTHAFFLYDATLHVPLIMRGPGLIPAGRVVEDQVRLVDLAPTILALVGMDSTRQMQGSSLLPLLGTDGESDGRPCYSDTLSAQMEFGYAALRCLRADGWKYIHGPQPELYHVAEDRMELFNLAGRETERTAAMRDRLRELIATSPAPPGSRVAEKVMSPDEIRKLQALGYLATGADPNRRESTSGGSELDHFAPVGPHPRDRIAVIEMSSLGLGAMRAGAYAEAEEHYRRFLEMEPDNAGAMQELGNALLAQGKAEPALEAYRKALELAPHSPEIQFALAAAQEYQGDLEQAEASYLRAIAADPTLAGTHLGLANIYAEDERYDEALIEYQTAASLAPNRAEVYFKWGMVFRALGRQDEAIDKLKTAVRLDPEHGQATAFLGEMLHKAGRIAEAIDVLTRASQAAPDSVSIHRRLAEWHAQTGNHRAATQHLQRAADLQPEIPQARLNYGLNLALCGKLDEAIAQYRKAIELKPDYTRAFVELARVLEQSGRNDQAKQVYVRLLKANSDQADAYIQTAAFFDTQGDAVRAMEAIRQGLAVLPDDPTLANDLAWRLATSADAKLRDGAEAVRLAGLADAAAGGKDASVLDTLAAAYAEAGQFDEAIATARRAAKLADQGKQASLAQRIRIRMASYQNHQPCREP
ncbi:MAG: sulfatase-like hydrolase/transferase [bacterium]|nr:sulfatase-like hydrolase/transferase [bacterium]